MAILALRFVSAALLSLLLEALGSGNREADSEEADSKETNSKVVHGKDIGNGKAGSKKVHGFLVDFALFIFLSSTKSYKERFSTYFLKSH